MQYKSVPEIIKALDGDDECKKSALKQIRDNFSKKFLFIMKQIRRTGKISRFDMLIYRLFYWRWNKLLTEDKQLRRLFHEWLHGFDEKEKGDD